MWPGGRSPLGQCVSKSYNVNDLISYTTLYNLPGKSQGPWQGSFCSPDFSATLYVIYSTDQPLIIYSFTQVTPINIYECYEVMVIKSLPLGMYIQCWQLHPSSSLLFRIKKKRLTCWEKWECPLPRGPTASNPQVPINFIFMLTSYDKRGRAQEMPGYLIYKDFTVLPLRMHFSPYDFEELEWKFTQTLLCCGVINNGGPCVTWDRGDNRNPTLPVRRATPSHSVKVCDSSGPGTQREPGKNCFKVWQKWA